MDLFSQVTMHDFIAKLSEQLILVGLATGLAIVIGIPLGVLVLRYPKTKKAVIGVANIMQTIPSLAMLAFLLPFLGIGIKPAILTISIYCLLPLVRNTIVGIENVPAELKEAGEALGFTFWQRLWFIELPLALPVIIGGIRIAVVMAVGITTLAAFIGAGGFGDYITQGLAMNNHSLILLGAIPTALLALFCDRVISFFEKQLLQKQFSFKKLSLAISSVFVIVTACVIFGGSKACFKYLNQDTVRVASKNFTEEFILAELMAEVLEAKTSLNVERQFNLGTTDMVHQAMLNGDVDIYPEYTGTAYLTVLHKKQLVPADKIFTAVKEAYQQKYNLTWLTPFAMDNSNALLIKKSFARRYHLKTITDLAKSPKALSIGSPAEFIKRADGYPGLKKAYGLNFSHVVQMDPALVYQSIAGGKVDVVLGFTTDGRIPQYDLVALQDDKHFYPPYQAAPVIRQATLSAHPDIAKALRPLVKLLDNKTMQQLNAKVDIEKQSPQKVAHAFLVKHRLT